MAIKPNDCVIKVNDLIIGYEDCLDMFGRKDIRPRYEPYWRNFSEHVDKANNSVSWNGHGKNPWDQTIDIELAKYGAKLKRTKEWKGNYIKFKSHKHLMMFVLKWS